MRLTNYPDVKTIRETAEITLYSNNGTDVKLTLQDLPPTYADELESALPTPKPPRKGILREGKKILRDDQNRPLYDYDWDDVKYDSDLRHMRTLQLVYFVTEGAAPDQLEFEADKGVLGEVQYYEAVLAELKAFGFGQGQVVRCADAVKELSGISDEDLVEARAGFTAPSGEG